MAAERNAPAPGEPLTIEQFERLPGEPGYRLELVRGRVVREPPPGMRHGDVVARLTALLLAFVQRERLGVVFAESGYVLENAPPTIRGPDISFVSSGRLPPDWRRVSYPRMAPDLAIEVLSPSNRRAEMAQKVDQYLAAGTRAVWLVDPRRELVTVRTPAGITTHRDLLSGDPVLPGLILELRTLFAGP